MPALPGLARSVTALAAAVAITVCGSAPAAAGPARADQGTPQEERIAALVHPALVRVTGTFSGRVRNEEGAYANRGEVSSFSFTCSGFGVHPDGYLATVGHCVDANDRSVRWEFIRRIAEQAVAGRTDITVEQVVEHGESAWTVEGPTTGGAIQSEIRVTGIPGTPADGLLARVVDDRPMGQGDVALLKVDITNMPVLELATGPGIAVGTRLFAGGYGDGAGDPVHPDARPTIVAGAVDEALADQGRPLYITDATMEGSIDGGPAVDESGRVLGLNSVVVGSDSEPLNLVVPISTFTDLLGRNGVRAELGPRDLLYRDALAAFDAGEHTDVIEMVDRLQQEGATHPRIGALRTDAETARAEHGDASENRMARIGVWVAVTAGVLVVVVVGALLLVRSRRRKRALVAAPWPPFPGPTPGGPWQGGPGRSFPPPAGQRMGAPGAPGGPFGPASHPRAPGHPVPPPQRSGPFDGATRPVRMPAPAWPTEPTHAGGSENRTTRIVLPTASTPRTDEPAPEETSPGERSTVDDADGDRSREPLAATTTDHAAAGVTAEIREEPENR